MLEAERASRESGKSKPAVAMTASLLRAIQRDPNPNGRWKGAVQSEGGTQLLIDVADPTGPNGTRTFVLTVREV